MERSEQLDLNIAFLVLDEVVRRRALELSQLLRDHAKPLFSIGPMNGFNLPHVSIRQLAIPAASLGSLVEILHNLAATQQSIEIHFGHRLSSYHGSVFWPLVSHLDFLTFQTRVVQATNDLRQGLICREHQPIIAGAVNIGACRLASLQKFGDPLVMQTSFPHLTLGKFEQAEAASGFAAKAKPRPTSCWLSGFYLASLGPHGVFNDAKHYFPLRQQ